MFSFITFVLIFTILNLIGSRLERQAWRHHYWSLPLPGLVVAMGVMRRKSLAYTPVQAAEAMMEFGKWRRGHPDA